jgi:PhzF family phenazine biosynthesis protein
MKLPLYWIDAFTARRFCGNPAAVVPLESWVPDATMQQIAFENGLAETAFLVPTGPVRFQIRWFTPAVEVDLCGHATLAAAFVLFTQLNLAGETVTFESRSGPLGVTRRGELLELDFPSTPPAAEPAASAAVAAALGAAVAWVGRSPFDLMALVPDAAALRAVAPDFPRVAALGGRGLIVTAPGDDCDFVSRFFAPQSGIAEDPVTGSTHCALVPFWAARLGRTKLHARQLSPRGGELFCELKPGTDPASARVGFAGHAVLYLRGEIEI